MGIGECNAEVETEAFSSVSAVLPSAGAVSSLTAALPSNGAVSPIFAVLHSVQFRGLCLAPLPELVLEEGEAMRFGRERVGKVSLTLCCCRCRIVLLWLPKIVRMDGVSFASSGRGSGSSSGGGRGSCCSS